MSSDEGSDASSYNSEVYGDVARSGFTRMYVLTYSALSPLDQTNDFRSESVDDDEEESDRESKDEDSRNNEMNREKERYQLFYGSGSHYFYGDIPLPEAIQSSKSRSDDQEDGEDRSHPSKHDVSIGDLPVLLPHFREQQNTLATVESVREFRAELRDVIYQMEEVGEFMVEELSKDKIIARIEQGSKEMHWMVSPTNPTFFELQTFTRTNEGFIKAGVVLIVMKLVVRGVLLDVIYRNNSYFVTLRENAEELALEDTYVPNGIKKSSFAAYYLAEAALTPLRHLFQFCYCDANSDADLKKLLLWCTLPLSSTDLAVEDKSSYANFRPQDRTPLPASSSKVKPSSHGEFAILNANDSQLYCLLPSQSHSNPASLRKNKQNTQDKQAKRSESDNEGQEDECSNHIVIFQFNQYIYHGQVDMKISTMNDLAKLTAVGFPSLRAQAHKLAFYGEYDDLPPYSRSFHADRTADDECGDNIHQFVAIRHRFQELATTLLDLMMASQTWISEFVKEAEAIGADDNDRSGLPPGWLAKHLTAWLENDDGSEAFFELELGSDAVFHGCFPSGTKDQDVELLVWKGMVNDVLMVVVYRLESFCMMLRPVPSEGDLTAINDATALFGALPPMQSKGRGYLVRQFPAHLPRPSQEWLANAKLLLWQTNVSLEREEMEENEAKHSSQRVVCADWFEEKEPSSQSADAKNQPIALQMDKKGVEVRHVELPTAEEKKTTDLNDFYDEASKKGPSPDKIARRHHVPPLSATKKSTISAPWDLKTGKPL